MIRSTPIITKRTPLAPRGMVVAEHSLGADVGAAILMRGGNAVDAAVATAFAMTVVEPFMSSIAGGGTMLIHVKGETVALDFNVQAAHACHETIYALADGMATDLFAWHKVVDDANSVGHRSVAVPGSVAGLCLALERYGTMELQDVMAPAIGLAHDGFIPDWYHALTMAVHAEELAAFPASAHNYLRNGHYIHRPPTLAEGDRVQSADLARSLALIAKEGPSAFYKGALGQAIVAEVKAGGGYVTLDDLAEYQVRVQAPLTGRYRSLELCFSPGATGGITALETLNILARFRSDQVGYDTVSGLHLRAEAVRRAFEDRLKYLGDPSHVDAPWAALESPAYAAAVAKDIRPRGPRSAKAAPDAWKIAPDARKALSPDVVRGCDCTTHIGVIDRKHNMVSLTHTAVSIFGSRVVVPGTGMLLSNGMLWFDPEPGRPNSVSPGKRALVNMVPVLAFKGGEPYLTLGAPGGRKIISAIPQVLSNVIDKKMPPQTAIEAPRLHTEGGELWVDDRVGQPALAALRKMGHNIIARHEDLSTIFFSRPVAIRITPRGLEAGLDHLRAAAAAGH
ncbi:MAG TPA: gamma-glutamyltransferase [Candidatus Baltobacteraceae bacterium]|nr:gamma-glutamyltransferase [Candidatus Baltobacteraceae bacterium]